jgi:hypothetical protein
MNQALGPLPADKRLRRALSSDVDGFFTAGTPSAGAVQSVQQFIANRGRLELGLGATIAIVPVGECPQPELQQLGGWLKAFFNPCGVHVANVQSLRPESLRMVRFRQSGRRRIFSGEQLLEIAARNTPDRAAIALFVTFDGVETR